VLNTTILRFFVVREAFVDRKLLLIVLQKQEVYLFQSQAFRLGEEKVDCGNECKILACAVSDPILVAISGVGLTNDMKMR
jgi:hypothetical protein